ncbi:MAG: imidazoleglycerol-phosphate dehydratase HisB [Deltaproteobacteria bacterium]|nr:imidazoleglycerol-phosphate dehydratase HisB [Deltaproteobacteria bacterium]
MTDRCSTVERKTKETQIRIALNLDGPEKENRIKTGVPFFDHMLTLFALHGFMGLSVTATGDIDIDFHHTIEDLGLVLGDALNNALGDRKGIRRYGHAATPMDETLSMVTIDLSYRPYLIYQVPVNLLQTGNSLTSMAKEFFRAVATRAGMNLHINVSYGENEHHILESIFKSFGRALDQASKLDGRIIDIQSSKGTLKE